MHTLLGALGVSWRGAGRPFESWDIKKRWRFYSARNVIDFTQPFDFIIYFTVLRSYRCCGVEFFLDDSTSDKSVCFCLLKFSGVLLKYVDLWKKFQIGKLAVKGLKKKEDRPGEIKRLAVDGVCRLPPPRQECEMRQPWLPNGLQHAGIGHASAPYERRRNQ